MGAEGGRLKLQAQECCALLNLTRCTILRRSADLHFFALVGPIVARFSAVPRRLF